MTAFLGALVGACLGVMLRPWLKYAHRWLKWRLYPCDGCGKWGPRYRPPDNCGAECRHCHCPHWPPRRLKREKL